jgi:hypothetical protein
MLFSHVMRPTRPILYAFFPKIQQITFRFWCMNEKLPQNAGNRISEVLDFKISSGSMQPKPPTNASFSTLLNQTTGPAPGSAPLDWGQKYK